jgi:autotransporter-associated beta strand protein
VNRCFEPTLAAEFAPRIAGRHLGLDFSLRVTHARLMRIPILVGALLGLATAQLNARTETWSASATSGDWSTPENWIPARVPDSAFDTATFDTSDITEITLSEWVTAAACVFTENADAFELSMGKEFLSLVGDGIVNNSPVTQNVVVPEGGGAIIFYNRSTITGPVSFLVDGQLDFTQFSSAGNATVMVEGGADPSAYGGTIWFDRGSTADHATFTLNGGTVDGAGGGKARFLGRGNGGDATFIVNGSDVPGASAGSIEFYGTLNAGVSAGNATIIVNGGGATGGECFFGQSANGGTARIELFGNGRLTSEGGRLSVGSIEGDASLLMHGILTVGTNDLSTSYSGRIFDNRGRPGSLTKMGTGAFTLGGANTYTGNTDVEAGALIAANTGGSATGESTVTVSGGTLGGSGMIAGAVTIGTGSGPGASLAPAATSDKPQTLTLRSTLDLKADATYTYVLQANGKNARTDKVIANGITIESDATFNLVATFNGAADLGSEYVVLSNTAATPSAGTFANLPDGGIISTGGINLQASYEGGSGTDMTLTVVP